RRIDRHEPIDRRNGFFELVVVDLHQREVEKTIAVKWVQRRRGLEEPRSVRVVLDLGQCRAAPDKPRETRRARVCNLVLASSLDPGGVVTGAENGKEAFLSGVDVLSSRILVEGLT